MLLQIIHYIQCVWYYELNAEQREAVTQLLLFIACVCIGILIGQVW